MIIPPHLNPVERSRFETCVKEIEVIIQRQGRFPFAYWFEPTDTPNTIEAVRELFYKTRQWTVMAPFSAERLVPPGPKGCLALQFQP